MKVDRLLVLRPYPEVDGKYLYYQLLSDGFIKLIDSSTYGAKMPRANPEQIGNVVVAVPSLSEQEAVAAFLDRETAKIDALVAKKERLIELLQEKRTALISQVVTKGFDPNVPMKDSGVEWLGEIPTHWHLKRLKFWLESMEQGWSPECENRPADLGEWGVLKVGCVNGAAFDPNENKALPAALDPRPEYEIASGDILMSRANTRELLGSASIVGQVRPQLLLCDKLYRLRVKYESVLPQYLVLGLGSTVARFQMEREATGASGSMQNISQDTVLNIVMPLPPADEQKRIITQLDRGLARIDALVAKVHQHIDTLREYRTALISAAVTGKIDVRGEVA